MSGALKRVIRSAVPERARWFLRGVFGWRWFEGNYSTWGEAKSRCRGYGTTEIVERVLASTLAVKEGRAAFERDGVLFAQPEPEPGLIAALESVARERGGLGRVLDFGGALGTTYWRHRPRWSALGVVGWSVVEQPGFVQMAAQVTEGPLRFFSSVDAAEEQGPHDVLLASGVLQYLEEPLGEISRWIEREFPWIVLNNLPLHDRAPDRIAIQCVPPEMGGASYPVRFFNRQKFLALFDERYEVVREFSSEAVWLVGLRRYPSTGLLLKRKVTA